MRLPSFHSTHLRPQKSEVHRPGKLTSKIQWKDRSVDKASKTAADGERSESTGQRVFGCLGDLKDCEGRAFKSNGVDVSLETRIISGYTHATKRPENVAAIFHSATLESTNVFQASAALSTDSGAGLGGSVVDGEGGVSWAAMVVWIVCSSVCSQTHW